MVDYKKKYLKYKLKYLNIKKKLGGAQEAQTAPEGYPKCEDVDYPCTEAEEKSCTNIGMRFITGCDKCKKDNKNQLGTCQYDGQNYSSDDDDEGDYNNDKKEVKVRVWEGLYTRGLPGFD